MVTAGSEGLPLETEGQKIPLTTLIINGWRLPKE
jgi:hypothetical protein